MYRSPWNWHIFIFITPFVDNDQLQPLMPSLSTREEEAPFIWTALLDHPQIPCKMKSFDEFCSSFMIYLNDKD